jgi:hypothetical protein
MPTAGWSAAQVLPSSTPHGRGRQLANSRKTNTSHASRDQPVDFTAVDDLVDQLSEEDVTDAVVQQPEQSTRRSLARLPRFPSVPPAAPRAASVALSGRDWPIARQASGGVFASAAGIATRGMMANQQRVNLLTAAGSVQGGSAHSAGTPAL